MENDMSNIIFADDREALIAQSLQISPEYWPKLIVEIIDNHSDDGLLYGHDIYFLEGSDKEVLSRISGLDEDNMLRIGPITPHSPE